MAKGKPYLLTWLSNVLASWQMDSNDVFQPVANVALTSTFDLTSLPFSLAASYVEDTNFVGIIYRASSTPIGSNIYSLPGLTPIVVTPNFLSPGGTPSMVAAKKKGLMTYTLTSTTTSAGRKIDRNTGAAIGAFGLGSNAGWLPTYAKVAVHPTGRYAVRPRTNGTAGISVSWNSVLPNATNYPNLNNNNYNAPTPNLIQAVAACWSPGGELLYMLDSAGVIQIVPFTIPANDPTPQPANVYAAFGAIVSSVPTTGLGLDYFTHMEADPSGSYVMVCHGAGTTNPVFTTVIYQRVGNMLTEIQRIANFGKYAEFTEDSQYIIDSGSKKAYKLNLVSGLYEDVSATVMVNVPLGAMGFLSPEIDATPGIANLYNASIQEFLTCGVDFANLKMIFLSSGAAFNASATTIAGAVGAFAVSDPNVPASGLQLQNVTLNPAAGGQVTLKANDLSVQVANNFTFRYSVLVDATNDTPLAFFDWGETFTIGALSGLNIDLSSRGIALFGV